MGRFKLMTELSIRSYGSWKSPITSDRVVTATVRFGQIGLDGEDIYWLEQRPEEQGRNVIVKFASDGKQYEQTPTPFNVRTRVHEYGGGAFTVNKGVIFFSNFSNQRLFQQIGNTEPQPITIEGPYRFADAIVDEKRNRLICVREDHTLPEPEPMNSIVSISLTNESSGETLVSGDDFYSNPRLSPEGNKLAWLSWNHPNMPWDGTQLWIGGLNRDGSLEAAKKIAGSASESIFQPEWSPDGELFFVSDKTGWWNLYRFRNNRVESLTAKEAEFGMPQWIFRMSTYDFISESQLVCSYFEKGKWKLALLDLQNGLLVPLDLPFKHIEGVRANRRHIVFIAGSPILPNSVVRLEVEKLKTEILKKSVDVKLDASFLSRPEAIEFPTENGKTAYAYYYAPQNRDYVGPEKEHPPLIVKSHGGPTASTSISLDLKIQFWTSRGFAVLDVNYGGSTGYGRVYRQRLDGAWGVVDVQDCINAAKYLAQQGCIDADRVAIVGGSAGGYTTLAALTFHDFFQAGASYYGISDLETLTQDTHKFESRYLDRLIGPYPEQQALYQARSPIHFTEKLSCPIILFQGLEDRVVPPNQAEMMVATLRQKGLPVAYLAFEGEQHGFRKAENIKRTLEAELCFYSKIFRFTLADPIQPIHIENL